MLKESTRGSTSASLKLKGIDGKILQVVDTAV